LFWLRSIATCILSVMKIGIFLLSVHVHLHDIQREQKESINRYLHKQLQKHFLLISPISLIKEQYGDCVDSNPYNLGSSACNCTTALLERTHTFLPALQTIISIFLDYADSSLSTRLTYRCAFSPIINHNTIH